MALRGVILGLAAAAWMLNAAAAEAPAFYDDKARGWYWYEPEPLPKKVEKPKAPPAPTPQEKPPEKQDKLSADWLRKNLDRMRDAAIDNPDDKEKVAAYMYAQRILFDKAQRFAESASTLARTDPMLDESSRVPADYLGAMSVQRGVAANQVKALKLIAQKAGIFFFFESTCDFCQLQVRSLHWLQEKYGFEVKNISMDGHPIAGMDTWVKDKGQAAALKLSVFPTTVLVSPPNNFFVISQGFHSAETMADKIMTAAIGAKIIPEDMITVAKFYDRGVLTPDDMRDPAIAGNPGSSDWVKGIRERLGRRY